MSHVITILASGFEETEAVTIIDILRRADIKVTIFGLQTLSVSGSHGISINTEGLLTPDTQIFDGIILPGGQPGTNNLASSDLVLSLLKKACSQGLLCAAICAAPSVLAKAGILNGKKASCYPGTERKLENAKVTEDPVSVDGNIITSRALGTAVEFSLTLVRYLKNDDIANKIRSAILAN